MHVSSATFVTFAMIRPYPVEVDVFHGHFQEFIFEGKLPLLSISTNTDPIQKRRINEITLPHKSRPIQR